MIRELEPLEFMEELQKEFMLKTFGEIINYDEYYQTDDYLDFLCKTYNFKYDKDSLNADMKKIRAGDMVSRYENPYYYSFFCDIVGDIHKMKDNFLTCEEDTHPIIGTVEFELFTAQINNRVKKQSKSTSISYLYYLVSNAGRLAYYIRKAYVY